MSEEIFKILLEEFKRNGVKLIGHDFRCDVFISDPADIIHETFERQCTTIPQLLDFSEHDKVFKDKIVRLEKQIANMRAEKNTLRIRCTESARDKFDKGLYGCLTVATYPNEMKAENTLLRQQTKYYEDKIAKLEKELEEWKEEAKESKKNRDEQLKSFRKAVEPYVDILHMHETIAELKQHIAELESKEAEKPTKINLNDRVKVKLTPLGAEIYYHQYDELNKQIKENGGTELEPIMPQIDKDGYTEFQLWHFIELYGKHIGMCKPNVIEPLDIVIVE